jgi:hypothetical protein
MADGASVGELADRMLRLLKATAETVRPCRECGEVLYFVRGRTGRLLPMTETGLNHFADCPAAERFCRERSRTKRFREGSRGEEMETDR